ncbi:MAG: hypothetical protein HYY85_00730 [Deltaproteobacteria bacterium]|nr:hypothetical protein [Deltaproteobacteria bacterium]
MRAVPPRMDPRGFALRSARALVLCTLAVGFAITYLVEQMMLDRMIGTTLQFYGRLTPVVLSSGEGSQLSGNLLQEVREAVEQQRLLSPVEIVSIKLYDRQGTLLYHSGDPSLTGKRFANPRLTSALAGEPAAAVSRLQEPEHIYERRAGHSRALELYVPIVVGDRRQVLGAYEVYASMAPLSRQIDGMRLVVWVTVLLGSTLLYLVLLGVFRGASRTILRQYAELQEQMGQLRLANQSLRQTQAELVHSEKLASTGRLAAGVVHEIGNPLACVLGLSELLARCRGRPEEREQCRDNLRRLTGEIERVREILRGLLDFARPEAPHVRPLLLNEVVGRTLPLIPGLQGETGITLKKALEEPSPRVFGDDQHLQQILVNLCLNALQAMDGSGMLTIATRLATARETTPEGFSVGRLLPPESQVGVVAVTDSGAGIPEADLGRIFEPFFSTKERKKGSGLGLAVCHRIIQEMGGSISVRSRPGAGSTFLVALPAVRGMAGREADGHA